MRSPRSPRSPTLCALCALMGIAVAQQAPVPVEQEPHHHVVLKNDSVIVTHVTIPPGESTSVPHALP